MASFYNNYYRYYKPYSFHATNHHSLEEESPKQEKNSSRYVSFGPIHFKNPMFDDINEPVFEILGMPLYLDDIMILGLLFFLYQEGVQDEMLYIALILLLL